MTVSVGAEWGGEIVAKPFKALPMLPNVKAAHNMNLNFLP